MLLPHIKLLHVLAVALYTGNIILSILWMHQAVKSGKNSILNHTTKVIMKSDRYITIPGVIIILLAGVFASMVGQYSIHRTGWIIWSFAMLLIAGFAFSAKLAPIHRKIIKETSAADSTAPFSDNLVKLISARKLWIIIAVVTTLLAFMMMVLRWPK